MSKKVTSTETVEYDAEGRVTKRTVVTHTEDYYPTQWYTPWWQYPTTSPTYPTYPTSITYTGSATGSANTTYGSVTWLSNDDDDDEGKAGVGA